MFSWKLQLPRQEEDAVTLKVETPAAWGAGLVAEGPGGAWGGCCGQVWTGVGRRRWGWELKDVCPPPCASSAEVLPVT